MNDHVIDVPGEHEHHQAQGGDQAQELLVPPDHQESSYTACDNVSYWATISLYIELITVSIHMGREHSPNPLDDGNSHHYV